MEIFLVFSFLLMCCLPICFAIGLFIRNKIVYKFRHKLIELISEIDKEEIAKHLGYSGERFKEFGTVSYDEMVWKFWRRCSSFYKDKRFFIEIKQRMN